MKVIEAMEQQAYVVQLGDTLQSAARIMAAQNVSFLSVMNGERVVGTITDRDIVTRCTAIGLSPHSRVRDAMTPGAKYCFDDEDLGDAMENMAELNLHRLPVMDRANRVVGTLSLAGAPH